MTEQDRQILEAAKHFGGSDLTQDLVRIIDRLDKQLAGIKETGKPFGNVYRHYILTFERCEQDTLVFNAGDHPMIMDEKGTELTGKHFRRLDKALKEIEG